MTFKKKELVIRDNQRGQTFMEFLMLLFSLMTISFLTINLINSHVAKRWKSAVEIIVSPDIDNPVTLKLK